MDKIDIFNRNKCIGYVDVNEEDFVNGVLTQLWTMNMEDLGEIYVLLIKDMNYGIMIDKEIGDKLMKEEN